MQGREQIRQEFGALETRVQAGRGRALRSRLWICLFKNKYLCDLFVSLLMKVGLIHVKKKVKIIKGKQKRKTRK